MQIIAGVMMSFEYYYFIGVLIIAGHLIIFQTYNLDISKPDRCLEKFKSNNYLGILVFLNILINKIIL